MKPINCSLSELFDPNNILIVPPYQRNYEWEIDQWHKLIQDIYAIEIKDFEKTKRHWMGIILLDAKTDSPNSNQQNIIDGQQRLVSLRILLEAVKHHEAEVTKKMSGKWLDVGKIDVQESDSNSFHLILRNQWDAEYSSGLNSQVFEAYTYFRWILWLGEDAIGSPSPIQPPKYRESDRKHKRTIQAVWENTLKKKSRSDKWVDSYKRSKTVDTDKIYKVWHQFLEFTKLELESDDEEPSKIFSTLNSKRLELSPFDNVRNRVFLLLDNRNDKRVHTIFKKQWLPAETRLKESPNARVDPYNAFLYDYLISKGEKKNQTISVSNASFNFERYIQRKKREISEGFDFEVLITNDFIPSMDLWLVAKGYKNCIPGQKKNYLDDITFELITTINKLSSGPPVPVILCLLNAYDSKKIDDYELKSSLFLIESFLIRRMFLPNQGFSPLRSIFMEVCSKIDTDVSKKLLREALSGYWVNDEQILALDINDPTYTRWKTKVSIMLRGIEKYLSGTSAHRSEDFSVEHIIPQDYVKYWKKDLNSWGIDNASVDKVIQSLGNLTYITKKQNSAIKNKSFAAKVKEFKKIGTGAPMKLNESWTNQGNFTPKSVEHRTLILREHILKYWK